MKLQNMTNEIVGAMDDMMAKLVRDHADEVFKGFGNMDSDEAVMMCSMMKIYTQTKDLALEQAKVMDSMEQKLEDLTEINRRMLAHIEEQNRK